MDTSAWGRREAADSLHYGCSFFLKYIHYSRSGDWLQEVLGVACLWHEGGASLRRKPISRRAGCLGSIYLSEFQNNEGYLISRYIYSPWVMFLKTGILKYGRIRDLRNDRGLTQAEIAEILKVKQNTYCQYETGTQLPGGCRRNASGILRGQRGLSVGPHG